jgi:hypothetical protein
MNRSPIAWFAALLLAIAPAARAQDDAKPLAIALLQSIAPATDDPDASVAALIAAARAQPRSPIAAILLAEAQRWIGVIQQPAPLLAAVDELGKQRMHGLVEQEVAALRWRLQRATQGDAAIGAWPLLGQPEQLTVCGPFGDAGDEFAGVPFPPELQFPAADASLPGRGEPALVRVQKRRSDQRRIELAAPPRYVQGCWYGRWRVDADRETDGFVEVEHDGNCQVFVDGAEVLRVERWRATQPLRAYAGLHLPAGGHEVIVKTCKTGRSSVGLRCVDGEGQPIAVVRTHDEHTEFAAGAAATKTAATFVAPETMLARLAVADGADPALRVAAVLAHVRDGNGDAAIDLAEPLRERPPADPATMLAWARVLRLVPLPDELRKAEARKFEERAAQALLPANHTARIAKAQLLEEQDQREDALRLLAAHPAPGPETFQRRVETARAVKFTAEIVPLLREWIAKVPTDCRPLAMLATELANAGAYNEAAALRARSLERRPDQPSLAATMCRAAMANSPPSAEMLASAAPAFGGDVPLSRLRLELDWLTARDDAAGVRRVADAIVAHPETDANTLVDLAARLEGAGDTAGTVRCLQRCRELGDSRPALRAWQARLANESTDLDEIVRFRLDANAAIAAFKPGEREQRSSTTLLIEQHVLLVQKDGSWTQEIHEVRRINDQAGVEAFGEHLGLGRVDEVLTVRTIAADGSEAVPAKVEGDYALPRLAPGSFVEWRYREHNEAPGAHRLTTNEFTFGSEQEPCALAQYVVVLPSGRGELRERDLPEPTSTATLADGRTVRVYEKKDELPLAKERFLPPLLDLVPCAQVGEPESSLPAMRSHRSQLGNRTRITAPLRAAVEPLVAANKDRDQAALANAIWSFCQTAIEDGNADDALQALLRKKGSRFLLAIALLRCAGFEVLPLACSDSRREQAASSELFPDASAVQLPGALLVLADGARLPLFLDTPRHWPLGRVPASRVGTTAWILYDDHAEPFVLPGACEGARNLRVRGRAEVVDKDVVLTATAEIGDVAGFGLAEQARQLKDNVRKVAARQIAQQLFPGWRIDSAAIANLEPGQAPRIEVVCKRGGVQRSGEHFVVPLPLPPSKFVATWGDRAERTLPWAIDADLQSEWAIDFDPGAALRVVGLPSPIALHEVPLDFVLQLGASASGVSCHRHVRVGTATRAADTFGDWLRALTAADRAETATIELAPRAH